MKSGGASGSAKDQPKQAAVLVLGKTASTLAEIITPLLLVRLITKSDLGVLASLTLIFSTTAMIAASGFPRALLYFLPNRPLAERRAIARRVGLILLALGVFTGLGILAFDLLAEPVANLFEGLFGDGVAENVVEPSQSGGAHASQYLGLISIYLVLELPTRMLTNMLIVEGRARAAAGTALLKSIGVTTATLIPAAIGVGIGGILVSIITFAALYLGLYLAYLNVLYRGAEGGSDAKDVTVRALVTFAIPLGMTDIVNILGHSLDRFLIMFFFAASAFAEYQIGAWRIPILSTIAYSVGNVYLPRFKVCFDEKRPKEAIDIWRQSALKVSLIVTPVALAFFVAAEELIIVMFTADYLEAVPIFRWYTMLTLARVVQFGAPLLAAGRPRYILYASVFALASNFAISLPLVLLVGFQGPAMGTAIAFIPMAMYYCYFIAKSSGVRFTETFPLIGYLRIVGTGAVAGAVGWVFKVTVDLPAGAMLPLLLLIVCAVFGVLATALNQITKDDWRFARDFVRLRVLR